MKLPVSIRATSAPVPISQARTSPVRFPVPGRYEPPGATEGDGLDRRNVRERVEAFPAGRTEDLHARLGEPNKNDAPGARIGGFFTLFSRGIDR